MSVRLNADGDQLSRSASLPGTTNLSWCGWVRQASTTPGNWRTVFNLSSSTSNYILVQADVANGGGFKFEIQSGGENDFTMGVTPVNGTWYFLAFSKTGTSCVFYWAAEGATALSSGSFTHTNAVSAPNSLLVGESVFGAEWWDGDVFGYRIWEAGLSAAELLNEMRTIRPHRTENLYLWDPILDQNDTNDWSGNGRNWTVGGSLTTSDNPPISWGGRAVWIAGQAAAGGDVELTVADATHGHAADSPSLTQANTLVVADATHAHAADSPSLSQAYTLSVAEASHAHTADSPSLTQANVLSVAEALHGHTADNVALTQANTLAVAEALHGHAADNVTVSGAQTLTVADATHALAADSPSLVQASTLAIADALHAHAADSPTLSFAIALAVQEALHAHTADSPTLTQAHLLAVQEALHAHAVDGVVLTQAHVLAIQDALHAHLADTVSMSTLGALELITRSLLFTRTIERNLPFTRAIDRRLAFELAITRTLEF